MVSKWNFLKWYNTYLMLDKEIQSIKQSSLQCTMSYFIAACNVIYLNSVDTESLTGPQAIQKAVKMTFDNPPQSITQVHFKVSNQGITLTDNQRKYEYVLYKSIHIVCPHFGPVV